jgi:hypothetical protein
MKRLIRICAGSFCIVAVFFFALPSRAEAYLDPGTGSVILQGILAAVAGLLVVGKVYWRRLTGLLRGRKDKLRNNQEGRQ